MVSCESCFNNKHGSPLWKLVLIIIIFTQYISNIIYHPVNLQHSNMTQILPNTTSRKLELLNIEEKLCRYTLHEELLVNYKKNRKYPKGMQLKFNLSLCSDSDSLNKTCESALRQTSFKLRDSILKEVRSHITYLSNLRKELISVINGNVSSSEFRNISDFIQEKIAFLTTNIKIAQARKYERDNIIIYQSNCRNRRYRKDKRCRHRKERKKIWNETQQKLIAEAKNSCPDQNAINLSTITLDDHCKSLLSKGPSFVPTPKDINWFNLKQDFDSFTNKLRNKVNNYNTTEQSENTDVNTLTPVNENFIGFPPMQKKERLYNYRVKPTSNHNLENFIEKLEKDIFQPSNYKKVRNNLNKGESLAIKELKTLNEHTIRVQDKGSRFVVLSKDEYCSKIQDQINRSSFCALSNDPTRMILNK